MGKKFPDIELTQLLIKEVFRRAIIARHTLNDLAIPVWDGTTRCSAGKKKRYLWRAGTVSVNNWPFPHYRQVVPANKPPEIIEKFFDVLFTRPTEKAMFLDWLVWCLQNEGAKPKWAPILNSATKGAGKSTLSRIVAALFGAENSVTQNNVDKLVSRFNMTVLQSKPALIAG